MTSLLSSLEFFASGMGIITTCAIAAAMVLLWNWRLSLLGLILVQFGVAAVALNTQRVEQNVMIVQSCVIILCTLILALSTFQAPPSPSIRQSGNWFLRLLALILLYFALRLSDFSFVLPLPDVAAGEALQLTIFFAWLCICSLLTLGFSDNPLFTGIALLLWCVPVHMLAAILTPVSGIVVLIGIVELMLALACSYLILTESFATDAKPVVATDVTFPVEGRRLLTTSAMVPIGEMTTMDIPAVRTTAHDRAAIAGKTLPPTAPSGTILAQQTQPPHQQPHQQPGQPPSYQPSHPADPARAQNDQQRAPQPTAPQPTAPQPATPNRQISPSTPLTRTNLRAVRKPDSRRVQPTGSPSQQPVDRQPIYNQIREKEASDMEPTRPTPNVFDSTSGQASSGQASSGTARQNGGADQGTNGLAAKNGSQADRQQETDKRPLLARLLRRK